jgi:hypothetical protein
MRRNLISLLLVSSSLFFLPHAQAQGGPGGGGPGGPGGGKDDMRKKSVSAENWLQEQMQQRFAEIESKLKLRPEQQEAWFDYQEKISALNADLSRSSGETASENATALQQIERKVDVVRNRLTALEDIQDAVKRLYKLLDKSQQKVADQLLAATVPALYSGFWQQQMQAGRKGGDKGSGGPGGKPGGSGSDSPPDGGPGKF